MVTLAHNVLFKTRLHDVMTGHKMIRTDDFRSLDLRSAGSAIESEIAARLVQRGERIYEVPVDCRYSAAGDGKRNTGQDTFRALAALLRCRFSAT